ncbi:uncharacterized protein LOC106665653 isoform X2 [Cimex lectularius]|uniref:Uncharacterized protein n=1 Tax=Cimex lectularius TaxID=79782 RepID=A0A8I6SQ14_CIMLE|nr:uncharacterized protein LOC106665653 isoform X2 [Cimex lectularius]
MKTCWGEKSKSEPNYVLVLCVVSVGLFLLCCEPFLGSVGAEILDGGAPSETNHRTRHELRGHLKPNCRLLDRPRPTTARSLHRLPPPLQGGLLSTWGALCRQPVDTPSAGCGANALPFTNRPPPATCIPLLSASASFPPNWRILMSSLILLRFQFTQYGFVRNAKIVSEVVISDMLDPCGTPWRIR